MVMSAVSSVSTPGVLVTVMPRCSGRGDVDIVDAVAEIGDQLEPLAGLARAPRASIWSVTVGTSTSALLHRLGELGLAHRLVVEVEARVEQLAHARFDAVRQPAGDHDQGLLAAGHSLPLALIAPARPIRARDRRHRNDSVCRVCRSGLLNRARRHCSRGRYVNSVADGRARTKRAGPGATRRSSASGVSHAREPWLTIA